MLFPTSRPYHIPTSTTDSQYAAANGYSSLPYNKWIQSTPESDVYAAPKDNSFSDISKAQHFRPREEQPVYSTVSSKRPIINYLLP
ncbi:unnamed protein product [Rotaria magnacalcarata]